MERIRTVVIPDSRRAWVLACSAAAANFMSFGVLLSFGVFLGPMADTFGTTLGPIAPMLSVAIAFYYLAGAIGGLVSDRRGPRPVVTVGAISLTTALAIGSWTPELWQLYAVFAPLLGIGVGSCYSTLIAAVGRAFDRQRSKAMGVVLAGVGLGTLVLPIACQRLIDGSGWRSTLAMLAAVAAVVLGGAAVAVGPGRQDEPMSTDAIRHAVGSRRFRLLYASVILIAPGFYAPLAFFNDYAIDRDVTSVRAAALVSVVGAASVAARLTFGWFGSKRSGLSLYRAGCALMLLALLIWLVSGASYEVLVLSAVVHGLGWALWVLGVPAVLSEWFGAAGLGGLVGIFYTGLGIGAMFGPALSGFVIDRSGHLWAIVIVAATTAGACVVLTLPGLTANVTAAPD